MTVEEYVKKRYWRTFEKKTPIIEDCGSHYTVRVHKDSSPIILSKNLL